MKMRILCLATYTVGMRIGGSSNRLTRCFNWKSNPKGCLA